jgi:hypothetical protein
LTSIRFRVQDPTAQTAQVGSGFLIAGSWIMSFCGMTILPVQRHYTSLRSGNLIGHSMPRRIEMRG